MFTTIAVLALVAYLAIAGLLYLGQARFIYPVPPARAEVPPGYEAISYGTTDGLELVAGYRPAEPDRPTLLFFHGNGADWQSTASVTGQMVEAGYGVLAAEYRGYAGNKGKPSEAGLYEDARAAWRWLRERGVAGEDIVLVGNSIGSGVAVHLATEVEAGAVVLISPFDSLEATASRRLGWLPVRWLLRDRYDNAGKLPQVREPVLILHGEGDSLIVPEQARALAAARTDTELQLFPGWGHDLVVNPEVQRQIAAYLDGLQRAQSQRHIPAGTPAA